MEVYRVPDGARQELYSYSALTWLTGSIEGVLEVPSNVFGDRPYRLTTTEPDVLLPDSVPDQQWIITDSDRAHDVNFGFSRNNRSYVRSEPVSRVGRIAPARTVQRIDGFSRVEVSSVGPGPLLFDSPAFDPANALDGDTETWWQPARYQVSGPSTWGSSDPFFEVRFDEPVVLGDAIDVSLYLGPFVSVQEIPISTTTDNGARSTTLRADDESQPLEVAAGSTERLVVRFDLDDYESFGDVVGLRAIEVPGTPATRRLHVHAELLESASEPDSADPAWVFTRAQEAVSPLIPLGAEDQIRRAFVVPKAASFDLLAAASATRGAGVLGLLGTTDTLSISTDSTWLDNPNVGPRFAIDGDPGTAWRSARVVAASRQRERIRLTWPDERVIDRIRFDAQGFAAPTRVVVRGEGGVRMADIEADGTAIIRPLSGTGLTIDLVYDGNDTNTGRPIGLRELSLPGHPDLLPGPFDRSERYEVACNDGLAVIIDGRAIRFRVSVEFGDLLDAEQVELTRCTDVPIALDAGPALLDSDSGSTLLTIDSTVIGNEPTLQAARPPRRTSEVTHWSSSHRTIDISAGDAAVLVVNEVFNDGWSAEYEGRPLDAIEIDGWRQGFLVPAGNSNEVSLVFEPDRPFKIGTIVGLITLAGVLAVALLPARRPGPSPCSSWSLTSVVGRVSAVALTVLALGIGAVAIIPCALLARYAATRLAWIAAGGVIVAAVSTALAVRLLGWYQADWGPLSEPINAMAGISLCAVAAAAFVVPADAHRSSDKAARSDESSSPPR